MEFPCTSAFTSSAKVMTSSRHARAGAVSKPEGPGVSRRRLRKVNPPVVMAWLSGTGVIVTRASTVRTVDQPGQDLRRVYEAGSRA